MTNEQTIKALNLLGVKEKITIFSLLMVLTLCFPIFINFQPVTGSLVNMSLTLAVFLLGLRAALLLALIPSFFALASGLLPPFATPMVPFIIISNIILIFIYYYLGKKRFGLAILTAGFSKFLFLYLTSNLLMGFLINSKLIHSLAAMMGWIQLFTAVAGGIMAYIVLLVIKKIKSS